MSDTEGIIINLDPNFLVPDEFLHKDKVFPWMYAVRSGNIVPKKQARSELKSGRQGFPAVVDILDEVGIPRFASTAIDCFCKAWRLSSRNQEGIASAQFQEISAITGHDVNSIPLAGIVIALGLLGKNAAKNLDALENEVSKIREVNPAEFERFQAFVGDGLFADSMNRQTEILQDYRRGIDQFNQTWIYASVDEQVHDSSTASSIDLRAVKMFYGEAFEQLATLLVFPACLNNVKKGRYFDTFERMTLAQYLKTNKASRPNPFADNNVFQCLHNEYDSVLRNASHHGAIRIAENCHSIVEFRSGDSGQWRRMKYSEYLLKCNRIQMCLLRTLLLQMIVIG